MKKVIIFFLFFSACASTKNKTNQFNSIDTLTKELKSSKDLRQFKTALKNMENKQYALAIPVFKKLAQKHKNYDFGWVVRYNLISSYKELNFCKKALKFYPPLIKITPPSLLAKVYLLMGYVYECLGEQQQTLAMLKKGWSYLLYLPEEQKLIEYPARLSLAYFRIKDTKNGQLLQQQVYRNLQKIKNTSVKSKILEKSFAQYLYLMGKPHIQTKKIKLKNFLSIANIYQLYLTQSILLSANNTSIKSEKTLKNMYQKIWVHLKKQNNNLLYKKQINILLNNLKIIAQNGKTMKIKTLYQTLKTKTLQAMS